MSSKHWNTCGALWRCCFQRGAFFRRYWRQSNTQVLPSDSCLVLQSNQSIWNSSSALAQAVCALKELAVLGELLIWGSRKEAAKINWGVSSAPQPCRRLKLPKKAVFWMIWRPKDSVAAAGSTETAKVTWSLPQSVLCVTKKCKILLSSHSCREMRKSLLDQLPWWGLCHCFLLVFGGEGHCSLGNVWGPGPWGTSLRGYRHLHPILEEGLR